MALGLASCGVASEFPTGPELYRSLLETEFEGASGYVQFDRNTGTRSVVGVQYNVYNIQQQTITESNATWVTFVGTKTAVVDFRANDKVMKLEPFLYADGTDQPPAVLPPFEEEMNLIPSAVQWIGRCLSILMLLACLAGLVWLHRNRRSPGVKIAQPLFLAMLGVGAFLIACSMVPMSFQEPMSQTTLSIGCASIPWFISIGFTTAYAALFSKLWRVNEVRSFGRDRSLGFRLSGQTVLIHILPHH